MKKKIIISIVIVFICIAIIATIIVLKTKTNKKVENEQLNAKYEEINQIDEENMKIDNEIEDISSQLGQLEQQIESEIDEGKKEEIKNRIKELQEKKQSLNDKKEENNNKKNETIIQIDKIKEDVQLNTINNQQDTNQSNNEQQIMDNQTNTDNENHDTEKKDYFIKLSKTTVVVEEGLQSEKIGILFSIDNIKDYHVTFNVSDESIANVVWENSIKDGIYIYGQKAGKTTITITDFDEPGAIATLNVTVTPKTRVKAISLDKNHIEGKIGKSYDILATITPDNAQEKYIHWTSSNENVATVGWAGGNSSIGIVKTVGTGTATITAKTLDGGYIAQCTVNVTTIPVEGIEITTRAKMNYYKGEKIQLEYRITPYDATNQKVTWKSDNTDIATVDSNGLVTFINGIKYKNVHITVTTNDGKFTDTIGLYCVPEQ